VLQWKDTEKLPWGILLLFGGGLALAGAMKSSGIINLIGNSITSIGTIDIFLITILLTIVMLFMTELMSNLALTTIFLPVVAGIALGLDADYLLMLVPVTIASSCAFMLPMATPPNAIVFASGQLRVSQMVKAGILLNTLAIVILAIALKIFFPFILEV
jgi:sodium-dependent dicarboxylate transporter 2/3/5